MRDAFWALVLILSENKKGRHLKKVTAKMCGIEKWFVLHFCTNHFVHRNLTKYFSKKLKFFRVAHSKLGAKALSFSSSPHRTWKRWEDIFFSCSQKWTRKNPETVAASGFSGAISFLVAQCGCGRRTRTSDLRVMSCRLFVRPLRFEAFRVFLGPKPEGCVLSAPTLFFRFWVRFWVNEKEYSYS